MSSYDLESDVPKQPEVVSEDVRRAVFGRTMGLVAGTVGACAVGAWAGQDLSFGWAISQQRAVRIGRSQGAFQVSGWSPIHGMIRLDVVALGDHRRGVSQEGCGRVGPDATRDHRCPSPPVPAQTDASAAQVSELEELPEGPPNVVRAERATVAARENGPGPGIARHSIDPAPQYDGGELIVSDTYGEHEVKLPAGDMVVYASSSLHRVEPVTRGVRVASFFWTQSLVRDDARRTMLYELDQVIQRLRARLGDDDETKALTHHYHNLLRQWAET